MGHAAHHSTILLIEDDSLIRLGTAAMLEDAGYLVLEAADADEGLQIVSQHPEITLVVTDVRMPGKIDGLGLVEILRRDYPQIRSVVTSGQASISDARHSGANKFLPKPYSADAMQSAIRALV